MLLLINHVQKMQTENLLTIKDYNFPLRKIFRYKNVASLKGAEASGRMEVEFAAIIRVEFIPEGAKVGPVKDIYFKIFKKGSCGIVGAVFGWPTLDHPTVPGGEGLGWTNTPDGAYYSQLHVTLPRLDRQRKYDYNLSVERYAHSKGSLMHVAEQTGDEVKFIDADGARHIRAAALEFSGIPEARMEKAMVCLLYTSPSPRD